MSWELEGERATKFQVYSPQNARNTRHPLPGQRWCVGQTHVARGPTDDESGGVWSGGRAKSVVGLGDGDIDVAERVEAGHGVQDVGLEGEGKKDKNDKKEKKKKKNRGEERRD